MLAHPTQLGSLETNRFRHAAAFPDEEYRQGDLSNPDTLYSESWLDLVVRLLNGAPLMVLGESLVLPEPSNGKRQPGSSRYQRSRNRRLIKLQA
jgi:hypothetical protein